MWYNCFNEYLLKKEFENNKICPCIYIKKTISIFDIVTVYADDLNLVSTPEELIKVATYLKDEFEMKDLRKINFFVLVYKLNIYIKWNIYPSINIYRKGSEALLYGQCSSFEYIYGCLFTWCKERSFFDR